MGADAKGWALEHVLGTAFGVHPVMASEGGRLSARWARETVWSTPFRDSARARPEPAGRASVFQRNGISDMVLGVSATGGSEMHVRTARSSDAAAMGALVARAWQAAYRGLMPDAYLDGLTADERADQWTRVLTGEPHPTRAVLVAEDDDGRVVGFIAVGGEMDVADATRGQVYALNVDPDRWGHGVGRALLAAGCGLLRAAGFATAVLWVHRDNARACRFYRAAGWRADGTERRADALGVEVPEVRYHHSLIGEPA